MKKIFTLPLLLLVFAAKAQLLTWSPDFIQEASTPVEITVDATLGNQGLRNYTPTTDVYVHIGAITSKSANASDWKYVKFNWGTTTPAANCTYLGNNKWKYSITGGLRTFFNITDASETIKKIAILFRSGNGNLKQANADGSDTYVPVYDNGLYARIDNPFRQPKYNPVPDALTKKVGDALTVTAKASKAGTLKIYFNGAELSPTGSTSATVNTSIAVSGNQRIIAEAVSGGNTAKDTFDFYVTPSNVVADLPAGVKDGINYEAGNTSAVLVLYAPGKNNVFVLGDFNNWQQSTNYQMNVTPDGNRFWIRLTGLTAGTEYAYQYLVDGTLRVADYFTEKVLDPNNDQYIPAATYPNLKAYPTGKTTGIVSILQTAKPAYTWQAPAFTRPDKRNLVIYELLVRDFVAAQNWQTLKDTLGYLKRLGINAIELMPFNEFEGNNSWGYNPSFYFAPDKAYGTETALKQFIDECHKQGFAVIMDMVLNHSFGQSPMVQMYWDGANNRPAANSPWFNPAAKHAYNVGYDFNHESQATKDFVDRVLQFWLTNYHIDGYRFDLSKGFTQKQTCDANGGNCNVDSWGAYDASRVAIWKRIYAKQQSYSAGSYCILEHFADNTEEKELSAEGMMLWGNSNYNFNEATMGWLANSNFDWGLYTKRGWTTPHLITYQESHDEERLMFKNEQYGNSNGAYNVKTIATGLKRNGMAAAFWALMPGPKMLWQFGEVGYDFSINRCENGTINDACRTNPKPVRWDYYQDANRKALYNTYAQLIKLKTNPAYLNAFISSNVTYNLAGAVKWLYVTDASLTYIVFGNFDVVPQSVTVTYPSTGTWYSYLTDSATVISNVNQNVVLQPGQYYVFTKDVNLYGSTLPVSWLGFTAQESANRSVLLKWSTSSEKNNAYYNVERSSDGSKYMAIGTVAAGNAPASVQRYSFTDKYPAAGINYYRIKQVDKDGKFDYSAVKTISFTGAEKTWQLYPNPARNATAVYAQANVNAMQVVITNLAGKLLYNSTYRQVKAGQKISLPVNISKGVYFLRINSDGQTRTEKLVVQ
ncbi:alpha-amylase family glycosyl hydrolase [Foetidibacter luteolus]|uniref:alpha-amylase family glycosyl hydrolase n=1 Tax=Foetidibacter luteolus TaxID=2608880 RepID=UPI00129AEB6F|nr:alpha-amylase family glycosyl hydrolase [Foetidibacter luteolus]